MHVRVPYWLCLNYKLRYSYRQPTRQPTGRSAFCKPAAHSKKQHAASVTPLVHTHIKQSLVRSLHLLLASHLLRPSSPAPALAAPATDVLPAGRLAASDKRALYHNKPSRRTALLSITNNCLRAAVFHAATTRTRSRQHALQRLAR
jgi:hypothetical protein